MEQVMQKSAIITCTNFGASHAANEAIYEILDAGLATSASLMVPCPWARTAAGEAAKKEIDTGVQLTLNAECENYRWGPITLSPSLLDGDGGFPRTVNDLWEHADPEEVRRECKSQIERAMLWGVRVSHLGSHQNALIPRPEYFDIYLGLSKEFDLPLRLSGEGGEEAESEYGFPFRTLADEAGATSSSGVIQLTADTDIKALAADLKSSNSKLPAEILCSPLIDTPEARGIHPKTYQDDIFIKEKLIELNTALTDAGIRLTNWSELSLKNQPSV